ncbi:hypothetical protein QYM36_016412 [Artemia franciscana]|uniref:BMP and activin membrane-bound inhibitor C-terminal domain-containing protein n=1 Tax=Artemia franciscana TaxID=6661 RepID=A0AA88KWD9_ARTSF|nr:hypothetical protein QYM36_016412 [Artemia franciscana]
MWPQYSKGENQAGLFRDSGLEHLGVNVGVLTSIVNQQQSHSRAEIWLKAATIAVPIAGGCILVILIMLAVKMLNANRIAEPLPHNKDSQNVLQKVLCSKGTEYALCPARPPRTVPMVQKKFPAARRSQSLQNFVQPYSHYQYKCAYNVTVLKEPFGDENKELLFIFSATKPQFMAKVPENANSEIVN